MTNPKITVQVLVTKDLKTAWVYYTQPEHITRWNFATDTWHCPRAQNELRAGGKYFARMEAKDGSFGFDFEATYNEVIWEKRFTYEFGGRIATVTFESVGQHTRITVLFDPENEHPAEMQQQGWQAILNNFKKYAEEN